MLTSLLSALEKKPLCDDKPFIERQKVICKKKKKSIVGLLSF